jgi:hypothetical protein
MDPQHAGCPNVATLTRACADGATSVYIAGRSGATACRACGQTFVATRGTPYYRLHHTADEGAGMNRAAWVADVVGKDAQVEPWPGAGEGAVTDDAPGDRHRASRPPLGRLRPA